MQEILGLSIFGQRIFFAGFFCLSTAIFIGLCFVDNGNKLTSYSVLDGESRVTSDKHFKERFKVTSVSFKIHTLWKLTSCDTKLYEKITTVKTH